MRVTGLPQPGKRTVAVDTTSPTRAGSSSPASTWTCIAHIHHRVLTATTPRMKSRSLLTTARTPSGRRGSRHPEAEKRQGRVHDDRRRGTGNVSLMRRVAREGHEIGNNTFLASRISGNLRQQLDLELKLDRAPLCQQAGRNRHFRPPSLLIRNQHDDQGRTGRAHQ